MCPTTAEAFSFFTLRREPAPTSLPIPSMRSLKAGRLWARIVRKKVTARKVHPSGMVVQRHFAARCYAAATCAMERHNEPAKRQLASGPGRRAWAVAAVGQDSREVS
jgi:hypothetical protein